MGDLSELENIAIREPWHDDRRPWKDRVEFFRAYLQLMAMARDTGQPSVRFITFEEAGEDLLAIIGDEGETVTVEEKKRLDELSKKIEAYAADAGRFESATAEKISGLREDVGEIKSDIKELANIVRETYAKVTNGQEDRIAALEEAIKKMPDVYLQRHEFNGFTQSMRNELSTLKWIFGIGMTLLVSFAAVAVFV